MRSQHMLHILQKSTYRTLSRIQIQMTRLAYLGLNSVGPKTMPRLAADIWFISWCSATLYNITSASVQTIISLSPQSINQSINQSISTKLFHTLLTAPLSLDDYLRQFLRATAVPPGTAEARISNGNSVCLSACLSVMTRYGFNARWDRDSRSSPYDSLESLVSYEVMWCQRGRRFPSNEGIKEGYPR